jgi:iron complex transport system ATP-binding protein
VLLGDGKVQVQGGWKDVLTASHLEAVYGVSAVVGTDQGMPYVIPTRCTDS